MDSITNLILVLEVGFLLICGSLIGSLIGLKDIFPNVLLSVLRVAYRPIFYLFVLSAISSIILFSLIIGIFFILGKLLEMQWLYYLLIVLFAANVSWSLINLAKSQNQVKISGGDEISLGDEISSILKFKPNSIPIVGQFLDNVIYIFSGFYPEIIKSIKSEYAAFKIAIEEAVKKEYKTLSELKQIVSTRIKQWESETDRFAALRDRQALQQKFDEILDKYQTDEEKYEYLVTFAVDEIFNQKEIRRMLAAKARMIAKT